jgi:hypothetical protein
MEAPPCGQVPYLRNQNISVARIPERHRLRLDMSLETAVNLFGNTVALQFQDA